MTTKNDTNASPTPSDKGADGGRPSSALFAFDLGEDVRIKAMPDEGVFTVVSRNDSRVFGNNYILLNDEGDRVFGVLERQLESEANV